MVSDYENLIRLYKRSSILGSVSEVLGWDQEVMMPDGALHIRAEEKALVASLGHEAITNPKLGKLLKVINQDEISSIQKANVREISKIYERAVNIPNELAADLARTKTKAMEAWRGARKKDDFTIFAPHLEKIISLLKKKAEYIDPVKNPYEVLMEDYEDDIPVADIKEHFNNLKEGLLPLLKKIKNSGVKIDDSFLGLHIPEIKQREFNHHIAEKIGYDFSKGRLDESPHPFTSCYGRITTRYNEGWFSAIASTIHEAGHGMYEHGLPFEYFGTPAGDFYSMTVHESQSRLYENHLGKSRMFWNHFYPELQKRYGLKESGETFYRAVNKAHPGFIRVNADELTYSLHIFLRFEIENRMMNGKVKVDELPSLWNELMEEYLGIVPPSNKLGVLQDIHWSMGSIGYFPTYTLGSMMSAQLCNRMKSDIPNFTDKIESGSFSEVKDWLNDRIWQHGSTYPTRELIKNATGSDFSSRFYLDYLNSKYKDIYGL